MMRLPARVPAHLLVEIGVNFVLPWLAYRLTEPHWGETVGLIASAVPPMLWSVVELLRFRRIDALSALVLLGIALSVAAMAVGGSPRLLLMRESLITGAVGVAFLVSLLLPRPLVFYLARATVARERGRDGNDDYFEELWRTRPAFGSALRRMTVIWGVGLVAEAALKVWMAWQWPVARVLVVSPFVSYGIYGALMAYTFWYRRRARAGMPAVNADRAGA
jgi:hypothetical protein